MELLRLILVYQIVIAAHYAKILKEQLNTKVGKLLQQEVLVSYKLPYYRPL